MSDALIMFKNFNGERNGISFRAKQSRCPTRIMEITPGFEWQEISENI